MKTNKDTIMQSVNTDRDNAVYSEVLNPLIACKRHRLKVDIRSNSYDFQSHARVKRWDGEQWQLVHSLHHKEMKTRHGMNSDFNPAGSNEFAEDRNELIRVAKAIIGGM